MAIVRAFGKPNLFITFTANAKLQEIQDSLHDGEKSEDRPDIVNRIFFMKLRELMDDIRFSDIHTWKEQGLCVNDWISKTWTSSLSHDAVAR